MYSILNENSVNNLSQNTEDILINVNRNNAKNKIVELLIQNIEIESLLKELINIYEKTEDSYYLSLVFFLPNDWILNEINNDSYLIRLVKHGYFYKKSKALENICFYKDNINLDIKQNIKLLTDWHITQQPLIIDNVIINFDKGEDPRMIDLVSNDVIYNYDLLYNNQQQILDYFEKFLLHKCDKFIENQFIQSEWDFVRKVDKKLWLSLLQEVKDIYEHDTPIEKIPYKLSNSIITFISLDKKLVNYHYNKDFYFPESVIENPSKLRAHLLSLVHWHVKKRFRNIRLSIPYINFNIYGNSLSVLNGQVLKEFPYPNKNLLIGILNFSYNLTSIRSSYPLEYVQLELNNINTYESLRVLDYNSFTTLYSEILKIRKDNDQWNPEFHTLNFLDQEFTYDCYSQLYYNLFTRINKQKNTYLLTQKAVNICCEKGFHFTMKVSLILNYLYSDLTFNQFAILRTMISTLIKNGQDIDEIIKKTESYIAQTNEVLDINCDFSDIEIDDGLKDISF
jgi:hypothetical protein